MWSRRRFLGLGALTAGAAVTAGCVTTQPSKTGESTPASIAALKPFPEVPVPITADERRVRIDIHQQRMPALGQMAPQLSSRHSEMPSPTPKTDNGR